MNVFNQVLHKVFSNFFTKKILLLYDKCPVQINKEVEKTVHEEMCYVSSLAFYVNLLVPYHNSL